MQNQIENHLNTLKLKVMAEALPEVLSRSVAECWAPEQLLEYLLALEANGLIERRIERRIKEARLPERKLLVDFDFDFQPKLDRHQIMSLASMDFVSRKQNVIFAGHSGTGKSHLAKALILIGCQKTFRCRYTTAADMIRDLKAGLVDDTVAQRLKPYVAPDLLMIDEIGFERLERDHTCPAALFFKVIDGRYGKKSTMMTTNLDFKELGAYLGDPTLTTAIVDRLVHHATIITIQGPSWRLHESKKLNRTTVVSI